MLSCLAQMVFWHALPTGVKTSTLKSRRRGDLQWKRRSLLVFNAEERDTSDPWRLSFFSKLRSDAQTFFFFFGLILFLTGYHLLHLHFFWLFTICGYLFGTMGDSVFLDRQNSYLVSTRFIGHKLIRTTRDFHWLACWDICSLLSVRARTSSMCVCLCEGDVYFLHGDASWTINTRQAQPPSDSNIAWI